MKLTARIKLLPSKGQAEDLLDTIRSMNFASCFAAEVGFNHKVFGQIGIHKLCYREIRKRFNLSAQMAVRTIGKVVACFSRDKKICPKFDPLGAIQLDNRLYHLARPEKVSILTLVGRLLIPFIIGDYFKSFFDRKTGQADLVYQNGQFYLCISIEFPEDSPIIPRDWIGVDFGLVNIATDSSGEIFSGERIGSNRKTRSTARKQYQRRGTKNAKRRLKSLSGRQSRFQKQTNHCISKRLVEKAKAQSSGIVLEDLKGIRSRLEGTVSKRLRSRLGNWGFAHLRFCIEYKARLKGIPVLVVNPRNTSRTCSVCGHCEKANRRSQAEFLCKKCNYSSNADLNAAQNLRALGLGCNKPAPKAAISVSC